MLLIVLRLLLVMVVILAFRMVIVKDWMHVDDKVLILTLMAAHNLAWKLSLVLDDLCPDPEKLLSSYSAEVSMTNIMYSL